MSGHEERLAKLGITLPEVVPPLAAYTPAVRSGSYVYTSGQVPIVDGQVVATGKLGAEITLEQGVELARICALNAVAALRTQLSSLDDVVRIVKVVVFVASWSEFYDQPAVGNGASDLLREIFGDAGVHARSAVGVSVLPRNVPVEVELIAEVR
ncbi:RidA family protein [Nonomuraea sp. NPDC050310]|uniref:RidA family protein n=1 Tax=Nonomuraea sp. NPDC050310 TaxID=3154935 RepID=UPI0033D2EEA2